MNESFFLTRQTANLMEDFDKELKAGPALYLLYGETRVGKSRLLQELIKTRLGDRRVHGLELRSGAKDGKGKQDRSVEIEKTFARAKPGDIIIADHFESALKKTRHQLLVSWSTDGVDKELHMIICSSLDGFNELRELALRYHVSARSFRLKPLAPDEIEAFYAFYLFRDELVGKLNIPQFLHKQISQTGGVIGELIDIAIRDGDQIENIPLRELDSAGQKRWLAGTVVSIALLAGGFGWYLYSAPDSFDSTADVPAQPDFAEALAQAEVEDPGLTQAELALEPEAEAVVSTATKAESDAAISTAPKAEPEAVISTPPEPEPEVVISPAAEPGSEVVISTPAEPGPETAAEPAVSVEPVVVARAEAEIVDEAPPESSTELEAESEEEIRSLAEAEEAAPVIETETTDRSEAAEAVVEDAVDETASAAVDVSEDPGTEAGLETSPTETTANPEAADDRTIEVAVAETSESTRTEPPETAPAEAEPLGIEARFERDLRTSLDWLDNRPNATGMVQIMLLNVSSFDLQKYYNFIDRLQGSGVDTSRIRVFETMTGKRRTYSVFYEEFISRRAAMRGIPLLPEVIQDTSPIPRSVGGLWDEIRRLEANN